MLSPWKNNYGKHRQCIKKNSDITLPTKIYTVKAMVFPVIMYGCESCTIKKVECQRTDAFKLWFWRRLLRVPWTAGRSNQSILGKSTLNIQWKDWHWSWSSNTLATWCKELTHLKRAWLRAGGEGGDRGWDGWIASLTQWTEFEQTLGDSEGQGSLACCSPWGHKESDTIEQLNNNNNHAPYWRGTKKFSKKWLLSDYKSSRWVEEGQREGTWWQATSF